MDMRTHHVLLIRSRKILTPQDLGRRSRGAARLLRRRRAEVGHDGAARCPGAASRALHVDGQGTEVLPDRGAAARPGRPRRREDLPGARLAPAGLRGAVRPGLGRATARRVDAVLPIRPGGSAPDPGPGPGGQADRGATRPGGAGPLELDPPVVGGPGPGRRLRPGLRRGGAADRGGWAEFWHYTALGRYGEQLQHLYALFPRDQVLVFRYRAMIERPAQTLDQICAFLGVPQGVLTELPRENVTAHPDPTLRHRAVAKTLRGGHQVTAALPGHAGSGLIDRLERILQQDAAPRRPLTWEERQALIPRFET